MARFEGYLNVVFMCGEAREVWVDITGQIKRARGKMAALLEELAEYAEACERKDMPFKLLSAYDMMRKYGDVWATSDKKRRQEEGEEVDPNEEGDLLFVVAETYELKPGDVYGDVVCLRITGDIPDAEWEVLV